MNNRIKKVWSVLVMSGLILASCYVGSTPSHAATATDSKRMTCISISPDGQVGNGDSEIPKISSDGRFVVYSSNATNLVPETTGGQLEIYLYDGLLKTTTLVSRGLDKSPADHSCYVLDFSRDGRYVVFRSVANNLVAGDIDGSKDIFVLDLQSGITQKICAAGSSTKATIDASGHFIVFDSNDDNLVVGDKNECMDIFLYDLSKKTFSRVSVSAKGDEANDSSSDAKISGNGQFVIFSSRATNLIDGVTGKQGGIFRKNLLTGEVVEVSVGMDGAPGNAISGLGGISYDGRYVAFISTATNLVENDNNTYYDVFIRDCEQKKTSLVSCSPEGAIGNDSSIEAKLSDDGGYVTFVSFATNLTGGVSGSKIMNVFVRDIKKGKTVLMSKNKQEVSGDFHSMTCEMSADGKMVIFASLANNFVAKDPIKKSFDVYLCDVAANFTKVDTTAPTWSNESIITPSALTANGVTLSWPAATDDTAVTGYKVYKDGALLGGAPLTVTTYNVTGLTPNTTYAFKVEAGDESGNWSTTGPALSLKTLTTSPVGNPLQSVLGLTPLSNLPNGTVKSVSALGLPQQVTLQTANGPVMANVTWDLGGMAYNPLIKTAQSYVVSGVITLPNGVINPNNISLNISVSVTINEADRVVAPVTNGSSKSSDREQMPSLPPATMTLPPQQTPGGVVTAGPDKADLVQAKPVPTMPSPKPSQATTFNQVLDSNFFNGVKSEGQKHLMLKSSLGELNFDQRALAALKKNTQGNLSVSVSKIQSPAVDRNKLIYDVSLMATGKANTTGQSVNLDGGTLTLTVPYTLAKHGKVSEIQLYLQNQGGKAVRIKAFKYNSKLHTLTFNIK